MTRGHGWRFLDIGRRLERSRQPDRPCCARRWLVGAHRGRCWIVEPLLEIADSSMTYRRRYYAQPQLAPALDLLLPTRPTRAASRFSWRPSPSTSCACRATPHAPSPTREERLIAQRSRVRWLRSSTSRPSPERRRRLDIDDAARIDGRRSDGAVRRDHLLLFQPRGAAGQLMATASRSRRRACTTTSSTRPQYDYGESVVVSHHVARLTPRGTAAPGASCSTSCRSHPAPAVTSTYEDYFGNPSRLRRPGCAQAASSSAPRSTVALTAPAIAGAAGYAAVGDAPRDRGCAAARRRSSSSSTRPSSRSQSIVEPMRAPSFHAGRPLLEARPRSDARASTTSSPTIPRPRPSRRR